MRVSYEHPGVAMSDIDPMTLSKHHDMQRYDLPGDGGQYDLELLPLDDGGYVIYEDALAAVQAAREEGYQDALDGEPFASIREQGQRDALAAVPDNDHGSGLDPGSNISNRGIQRYEPRVTCMAYCCGGSVVLEEDEYLDEFDPMAVVKLADYLAAVNAAENLAYLRGQRDEREAAWKRVELLGKDVWTMPVSIVKASVERAIKGDSDEH